MWCLDLPADLDRSLEQTSGRDRVDLLHCAALDLSGDDPASIALADEAEVLLDSLAECYPKGRADSSYLRAREQAERQNWKCSTALYQQALVRYTASGDRHGELFAQLELAIDYALQRQYLESHAALTAVIELSETVAPIGDLSPRSQATYAYLLSYVYFEFGLNSQARDQARQALDQAASSHSARIEAAAACTLAVIARREGDWAQALRHATHFYHTPCTSGSYAHALRHVDLIGAYRDCGQLELAYEILLKAQTIERIDPYGLVDALLDLECAGLYRELGHSDDDLGHLDDLDDLGHLDRAVAFFEPLDHRRLPDAYSELSLAWEARGNTAKAYHYLKRYLETFAGGWDVKTRQRVANSVALQSHHLSTSELDSTRRQLGELVRASEELRHSSTAHAEMTAMVAHDLRDAVTNAQLLVQLAKNEPDPSTSLDRCLRTLESMSASIEGALSEFRTANDGDVTTVDFTVILAQTIDVLTPQAVSKRITIVVPPLDTPAHCRLPTPAARSLVLNLLSNAIKYTTTDGTVTIDLRPDAEEIVLAVSDDGVGIATEQQDRLFSRFAKLDNTPTQGEPSSGYGLYHCKRLLDAFGGTIGITSPGPGQGTTVVVRIPAAA